MKSQNKQTILKAVIILSFIGLLTSLYLIQNHYTPPGKGSFCDVGETLSCSLVNTSVYSEFLNVPVALMGAIWFVIMLLLCWKALKKDDVLITGILGWSILGTLSIIYFVTAEIILKALCPLCTVVHIILIMILILSIIMYRGQEKKPSKKILIKALKPWVIGIIIINFLPFIIFNFPVGEKENYDALAQCITDKGVVMYGSFRCGVCAKTRAMFGDSFQYIKEIECHPRGENAQTQLCIEKQISGTPTWVLEPDGVQQKRATGFLSTKELHEFAGCDI